MKAHVLLAVASLILLTASGLCGTFGQTWTINAIHNRQHYFETTEDLFHNDFVNGTYRWWISINNREDTAISNSCIEVLSKYPPDAFNWFSPDPTSIKHKGAENQYEWQLGTIVSNTEKGISFEGKLRINFIPGFDSQRIVTPNLIESENATETIIVKVTPREELHGMWVGINLGEETFPISGSFIIDSASPRPNYVSPDGRYLSMYVEKPEVDFEYNFTVQLRVKNKAYPGKVFYKPWIHVGANSQPPNVTRSSGSSFMAEDDLLGTITYSADGRYNWEYYGELRKIVTHKLTSGIPFVSISIDSPPQLSVMSGTVNITATAAASTGQIATLRYNVDNGSWIPMKLSNNTGFALLDTTTIPDGGHVITIEALDSNGISGIKSVTIIVDNAGPRFTGYGHITNLAYVVTMAVAIVASVWIKSKGLALSTFRGKAKNSLKHS